MKKATKNTQKKNRRGQTNYPLGDFLVRIKNAALAKRKEVVVERTNLIEAVAGALKKQGLLSGVTKNKNQLTVELAYHKKEPLLIQLKLISKPGLRIYMGVDELENRKRPSTLILSTPKGMLTARQAIKARVGGEVVVEVL